MTGEPEVIGPDSQFLVRTKPTNRPELAPIASAFGELVASSRAVSTNILHFSRELSFSPVRMALILGLALTL